MFNDFPFGIVRTAPFCTTTFAGAVALVVSVQLDVIIQSPVGGGEQGGKAMSLFVMVHVLTSPSDIVMEPSAAQSPPIVEV